jgi:hypothetical protein
MGQRIQLQKLLSDITQNVYFQPPPEFKMQYPCIVYHVDRFHIRSADNTTYKTERQYMITVITQDPDSDIPEKVAKLPRSMYDRHFNTSNLNHDVFSIIF